MATLDNKDRQTAIPPILTERRAEICPLCSTLNHTLSRECFNCGWCRAFPEGDAGQEQSRPQFQIKTPLISLWWQNVKTRLHIDRRR